MRLIKYSMVLMSMVCVYTTSMAQTYLNSIYRHDAPDHIFTESIWYKDTLFVFGVGIYPDQDRATISKFNRHGDFFDLFSVTDTSDEYQYSFWQKGAEIYNDTIFHAAGKKRNGVPLHSSMFKLDLEGNPYLEAEFTNAIVAFEHCRIVDFIIKNDGILFTEVGTLSQNDHQICISRIDHQFNTTWRKCYGNLSREWPFDLLELPNGNIVGLGFSNNLGGTGSCYPPGACFHSILLIEVDQEGNLIREWRSEDEIIEAAWAAHAVNDSLLVIAASDGTLACSGWNCDYSWVGKAMMINIRNGQKIWETSLSAGQPYDWYDSRMPDVIPSIEGDGYIFSGGGYYTIPDCRPDTMGKCWAHPGIIAKVSNEGDSLWMRKYFGVYNISEANMLLDAEIVPDSSGYSFVGEAFTAWAGETQGQHGWLLMTDRYGCLVPGCHLISSDENAPAPSSGEPVMKVHPNPATAFLNILITRRLDPDASLQLVNMNGQILDQWNSFEAGATYIIPTDPYPSGMYALIMTSGGKVIDQQKVIIQ